MSSTTRGEPIALRTSSVRQSSNVVRVSLNIRLLGVPTVEVDGLPLVVDTKKAVGLLAYLADDAGTASRDRLADLFWPDSDPVRARASLRRTLAALKRGLGERWIEADRDQIAFVGDDQVVVDVALIARGLAEAGHNHDPSDVCELCIPLLRNLVELVRGPFLDGFSLGGSATFDDWVTQRSLVHHQQISLLLERLAIAEAGIGDYEAAIQTTIQHLSFDPIHEPAHRSLMRLSAWAGDRPAAIEAYRHCVRVLETELGVKPLEETTELYEAILDNDLPRAPAPRRSERAAQAAVSGRQTRKVREAVGRADEWSRLLAAVDAGSVVVVSGGQGLGKTMLLDDLANHLRRSGETALIARARLDEGGAAYRVVQQLLEQALAAGTAEPPGWVQSQLARLLPDLGGDASIAFDSSDGRRFVDACVRVLAGSDAVILVDDADVCDQASAGVLARVVGESRSSVVVAHSLPGGPPPHPLLEILDRTSGRPLVRIELPPLSVSEVAELAANSQTDPTLLQRVTGGVPLFVQAYLDSKLEPGSEIPDHIQALLSNRLDALPRLARQVLSVLAVIARPCDFVLLREVSGRGEEELLDVVDDLASQRLLREVDGEGMELVHELLRSVVLRSTTGVRQKILHGRAALALSNRADAEMAADEIAVHFEEADDSAHAADWYSRSAGRALAMHALVEAGAGYKSALQMGHPDPGRIHMALGEIAMLEGHFSDAILDLDTAASLAHGSRLGEIEHRLAVIHHRLGNLDIAHHYFESALVNHEKPASLLADWSLLQLRVGDGPRAKELADAALASASDAAQRSRALTVLGLVAVDPVEAEAHLQAALESAGSDAFLRMAALNGLSLVRSAKGEIEGALEPARQALVLAREIGDRHRQAALHDRLADIHHMAGRPVESDAASTEAAGLFASINGVERWEPEIWLFDRW